MNNLRQHFLFRGFALTLVLTLLLPSAVKAMHSFEKHQHEICYGESDSHVHTLDIDCEFYKFKLNIPFTIPEKVTFLIANIEIKNVPTENYRFLSEYQSLHFSLRGPPAINLI